MGRDTIAEIITSIRNADMDRKRVVRIASTNITENIVKILFREGGMGIVILSTSRGIMTDREARLEGIGGSILFRLDNQDLILGYVSGKIRRSLIRILTGDKVKIEDSKD
ncbi:Ribosomal protein S8 [Castilleja foliolosa]|uniref:Small ribosomal subunit protein uS8c n=1 Tax=Castilleja foliolosa TaxID=1961234 RepID=A0ABD3E0H1_9LAMI